MALPKRLAALIAVALSGLAARTLAMRVQGGLEAGAVRAAALESHDDPGFPGGRIYLDRSLMGFPTKLLATFKDPEYLFTGGFGEAWSVAHHGGRKVVKFLHNRTREFLTWKAVFDQHDTLGYRELVDAAKECDISKDMRHRGPLMDSGSKYIMDCYWHNINVPNALTKHLPSMGDPLFLVLEHCGDENLDQFMTRRLQEGTWTPELVVEIYVELLEALAYLGRHPKKWVHHDLKPSNIVIRTTPTGKVELHLIDVGAAVVGQRWNQYNGSASTQTYHPIEWGAAVEDEVNGEGRRRWKNFEVCEDAADGRCQQSFDMFSATSTLIELIIGDTPLGVQRGWRRTSTAEQFKRLGQATKDPAKFVKGLKVARGHVGTSKAFKDDGSVFNKVLLKAVECLDTDAARRPAAKDMLAFIKPLLKSLGL